MEYCRNLSFEAKPDYKYLINLFENTYKDMNYDLDYKFCWITQKEKILEEKKK